jgi:hypothetical protein
MNKLREAAEAVVAAWDSTSTSEMFRAMPRLRKALAEDRLDEMQALTESDYLEPQYELWGRVIGASGGRWPVVGQFDGRIWPVGTALYVRVGKKKRRN